MNGAVKMQRLRRSLECFRKTNAEDIRVNRKIRIKKQLELDYKVQTAVENGTMHPRNHPGVVRKKADELPDAFVQAMVVLTERHNKHELIKETASLSRRLWGRHMPAEERDYIEKIKLEKMKVKAALEEMDSEVEEDRMNSVEENVVSRRVKDIIHPWHPLNTTAETCLHYLFARTPAEYCILHKIFTELHHNDPEFVPLTLFDFGSGVASGYWAVKDTWQNPLKEVFNVDSNLQMNEMARKILQIAKEHFSAENGVFFRQFFPVAAERTYDITLSAFTLLELPSFKERMEAVSLLWSKTEKYLVIVEDGTNAGYKAVMEARNLIIHLETDGENNGRSVHVVAPCPHEFLCPRFTQDNTPCNFEISYLIPKILEDKHVRMRHRYSYVVLKKGPRPCDSPQWARSVRETRKHGKQQLHFSLCTPNGKLENVLLQKAYNCRNSYRCAKYTKWGDCLPGKIRDFELEIPIINDKPTEKMD